MFFGALQIFKEFLFSNKILLTVFMASVAEDQASIEDGELLDPINLTPRVSRGNNPVSEAQRKNTSDNCTAVQSKKRERELLKVGLEKIKGLEKTPL